MAFFDKLQFFKCSVILILSLIDFVFTRNLLQDEQKNIALDYDQLMHPSFPTQKRSASSNEPTTYNNQQQNDNSFFIRDKREYKLPFSIASTTSITNENDTPEQCPLFWKSDAQYRLKEQLDKIVNKNRAKNVIFFLGDGMSLPTVAAARMHLGQRNGFNGEESELYFEKFPYTGLSKTYCVDKQVADSACSATAYLTGVKANYQTIGVSAKVELNNCNGSSNPLNHVQSILQWAQDNGKGTGIVTTTRVTHASPAGTYAHVANRNWESDANVFDLNQNPKYCQDIASQLIDNEPGTHFKVILGGGAQKFLPNTEKDDRGQFGERIDKRNLINEWKKAKGSKGKFVQNRSELEMINYDKIDYLFGLFETSHMNYNLEADRKKEPSLSEMTEAAIKMLSKEPAGYILFVEGGRIDHGHHENRARKALDETVEFSEAIRTAVDLVDIEDTLIVVTADHAHTMSISGYSNRGQDILGLNTQFSTIDNLPYTTLSYANGKGIKVDNDGKRLLLTQNQINDKDFEYASIVPLVSETHGGDDVGVYALGPWSHLFAGVYEQNVIPHIIGFASCIGDGLTVCDFNKGI